MSTQYKSILVLMMLAMTVNMNGKPDASSARTTFFFDNYMKQHQHHLIQQNKTPTYAFADKYDVIYKCPNGTTVRRRGGSRAWRNNNPGCIRYSEFSKNMGAIGHAGGFAVFPSEEVGMNAICSLLRSKKYAYKTICGAINSYAPECENDTERYQQIVQERMGLSGNTIVGKLNDDQMQKMASVIRSVEGWNPGQEIIQQPNFAYQDNTKFALYKNR